MKVSELLYNCVGAGNITFVNAFNESDTVTRTLDEYICTVDIFDETILEAEVFEWEVDNGDITIKYKPI